MVFIEWWGRCNCRCGLMVRFPNLSGAAMLQNDIQNNVQNRKRKCHSHSNFETTPSPLYSNFDILRQKYHIMLQNKTNILIPILIFLSFCNIFLIKFWMIKNIFWVVLKMTKVISTILESLPNIILNSVIQNDRNYFEHFRINLKHFDV